MAAQSLRENSRAASGASSRRAQIHFTSRVVALFVIITCCAMGFVTLAEDMREQETLVFDQRVLAAVHDHSGSSLDMLMPIATDVGGAIGVSVMTATGIYVFLRRKDYARVAVLVLSVLGATALNLILKSVFMRQRPDMWVQLVHETGYSFPSGHAMMSAALGVAIAVLLWDSKWRWWAFVSMTLYVLFVGFSRLYLGVHYPTDIIAGWCVSGAWVMAVVLLVRSQLGHRVLATSPRA